MPRHVNDRAPERGDEHKARNLNREPPIEFVPLAHRLSFLRHFLQVTLRRSLVDLSESSFPQLDHAWLRHPSDPHNVIPHSYRM